MQQQVAGRYTLLREVGRGGMGAVWLARDEVLVREVALKRLAAQAGTGAGDERLRREARVSAMLNHAGVVTVYDLADDGDDVWLVMEYVESVTLSELVRQQGPLSPEHAADLVGQAADALAVAHEAGIVHRDVKPGNMLVTAERFVKLGDFGIARTGDDASLTATGLVTGSPGYLAPEVAAGASATAASDVWSLGATIFHTLTGKPPYETHDNLMGTLYRIVHEEPPRTDRAGWLEPVLLGTMERDPARRWSARQVHVFLTTGPGAVPPSIPPPTAPPRRTAPAAVDPGERTQVVDTGASRAGSSRTPLLALVAVVMVLILGIGAWLMLRGGGDDDRRAGGPQSTATLTTSPTSPDTSPSEPSPNADDMEQFTASYLGTVTSDPRAAFDMLTPAFQEQSGGFRGYRSWWRQVEAADLQQVDADPDNLTVSYRVRYTMQDGGSQEEDITLGLEFDDGTYRISSEQ